VRVATALLLPLLLVAVGVAILVRTLVAGGGPLAFGVLMGLLFVAAGVARLLLERKR
jgi:uncharacterized membrane protein